jgi:hypothetical protein
MTTSSLTPPVRYKGYIIFVTDDGTGYNIMDGKRLFATAFGLLNPVASAKALIDVDFETEMLAKLRTMERNPVIREEDFDDEEYE